MNGEQEVIREQVADEANPPKSRLGCGLSLAVLMPILYVLSLGPAVYLVQESDNHFLIEA